MAYQLYWGDLHSHCSISYGLGTVEQALARAREQLDFCSITGHAFWPDMPTDRSRYGEIIDYHNEGFVRLAKNWPDLIAKQGAGSTDGEFLAFPSYEWHSLKYGDHNVYSRGPKLDLKDAVDLRALRNMAKEADAIIIPHHIGYAAGYRGIDWNYFMPDQTPFVEIHSLHGCSLSEDSPFPMLHDMGPRDYGSTAVAGWLSGHRFGVVGGTDHHGAYPGSHGDGRMGVFATSLTRDAIWEAFLARRVYAATGDKIEAKMFIDDAWIGSEIKSSGKRTIRVSVHASDAIDRVELLKNERVLKRFYTDAAPSSSNQHKLRVTWGWGRKDEPVPWQARLFLSNGRINRVETCFSGQSVAAPQGIGGHTVNADAQDLPHAIIEHTDRECSWRSITTGNLSLRHPTTQAISFEIDTSPNSVVTLDVNQQRYAFELQELLHAGRTRYLRGWLSEAVRIGPAIPLECCSVEAESLDEGTEAVDMYRLQVFEKNGQVAWLTPIWVQQT